jgi:hypothetical protein
MPLLTNFDTPASLRDVSSGSPFYTLWSDFVRRSIADFTAGDNGGGFFDPTAMDANVAGTKAITWMGFPRDLILPTNRDNKRIAYQLADADIRRRSDQNEYFEWYVVRNKEGKITKITFVTELPEYYEQLWQYDPDEVVRIYNDLVGPGVVRADLVDTSGNYTKLNRWNTTDGIVHDINSINTLGAAIGLCQSSVNATTRGNDNFDIRVPFSSASTSVDPRASYDVNMLARKGLLVTLADPAGVYIADWDNSGISQPDGSPAPDDWWRVMRGSSDKVLRLEYSVPDHLGFVVGDLKLGGRTIEYGGQLAEQITVVLHGLAATRIGR